MHSKSPNFILPVNKTYLVLEENLVGSQEGVELETLVPWVTPLVLTYLREGRN